MSNGWIGVDFDGTLAHYTGWNGGKLGLPIPVMVERVKTWLAVGFEVRIVTARASDPDPRVAAALQAWCVEHLGQSLVITCCKDFSMVTLYDDRCVQVEPNTGELIGKERELRCPACKGASHSTGICQKTMDAAVLAEREACAQIAEATPEGDIGYIPGLIRARGAK